MPLKIPIQKLSFFKYKYIYKLDKSLLARDKRVKSFLYDTREV